MHGEPSRITDDGQLVLPKGVREQLGWEPGDRVLVELSGGELKVRSLRAGIERAQEIVRKHVAPGVSLADELIRERRAGESRE